MSDASGTTAASRITDLAMEAVDTIRDLYGEDATVGSCVIVADVVTSRDGNFINPIYLGSNDPRKWVQQALLEEGVQLSEVANLRRHEEVLEALGVEKDEDDDDGTD